MEKFKGILWQRDSYTDRLIMLFRYASIISGVGITAYGALVYLGLFSTERFHLETYVALSVLFLIVGVSQFFDRKPNLLKAMYRIVTLHLLAMGYLLLVTGFQSPLTIAWLVLFVSTYFYFDKRAFFMSVALLALTALLDIILVAESVALSYFITNIALVAVLTFVGFIMSWLGHIQAQEHEAFIMTRINEGVQRDRMLTTINSIGDAILNTDEEGVIRTYNAASLNLFDTNKSLNGQKLDELLRLHDEQGNDVAPFAVVSDKGSMIVRDDLSYKVSADEVMRLSVNASPVQASFSEKSQGGAGYIFIIRDITKTKSLEDERDEFISVVSHELRTPITIAEGTISNAQVLLQRGSSKEQLKDAVDGAHQQIIYLARMINDLSTLSRAERGLSVDSEEIDVDQLARSVYREYQPQAAEKKLQLNIDVKGKIGTLHTSKLYLEEILQNFMMNAIKYTQKGSVTLAITRNDESVTFAVTDSGIGISKTDQRKIFYKFYRSEDYRTRETSGTGLGLYIVGKLAQKINAKIDVRSRLNHGSTFSVTISDIKE